MSEAPKGDLQFDRAEFSGGAQPTVCATCRAPIRDTYYEVDGQVTCDRCRRRAEFARTSGSAPARFAKAAVFGTVAAAVGAGLYYGVRALTGYEFGLIAIVVGLMVGGAVRAGSGNRGGVPYQLLAMFLTYASIVSTYIPPILQEITKANPGAAAPATADGVPAADAPATTVATAGETPAPPAAAAAAAAPSLAGLAIAVAALVFLAFAAPFLMGIENVIGIVIIGIGLFEAWKINRKTALVVAGPFRMSAPAAAPAPTP
jgi:hypothetical protein